MALPINAPFYAGIGSRDTPSEILTLMTDIAAELREAGYILRSGHADGADIAFEKGSAGQNQIWLPWQGFNYDSPQAQGLVHTGHYVIKDNWVADRIAAAHHPAWNKCSDGAKKLHTRNVYQVTGPGLGITYHDMMSRFVVCWTRDGKDSGGTGQAIRIAATYKIPVFNLQHADGFDKLAAFLQGQA
jgi:hypothetical protein